MNEQSIPGRVLWFNNTKGFGFAVSDEEPDTHVFIHYSSIQTEGYRTLAEGQRVAFLLTEGPKGRQAVKVWPLP